MENETISITFNGVVDGDNAKWIQWYNDAKKIIRLLGYEPTHVGIDSTTLTSGKVMMLRKSEKKIVNSIKNGDKIKYISMFSLPDGYKSASFDYNVLLARDYGYITLIMNKSDFNNIQEETIISILRKYIDVKFGEVYEMYRSEFPLFYAAKDSPASSFKTLKIIKEIH